MANTLKSNTTQNVAVGGAASGGIVYAVLAAIRSVAPDLLPWPPEHDVSLALVLTAILTPLISRVVAFKRHPEKSALAAMDLVRTNPPKPETPEEVRAAWRRVFGVDPPSNPKP